MEASRKRRSPKWVCHKMAGDEGPLGRRARARRRVGAGASGRGGRRADARGQAGVYRAHGLSGRRGLLARTGGARDIRPAPCTRRHIAAAARRDRAGAVARRRASCRHRAHGPDLGTNHRGSQLSRGDGRTGAHRGLGPRTKRQLRAPPGGRNAPNGTRPFGGFRSPSSAVRGRHGAGSPLVRGPIAVGDHGPASDAAHAAGAFGIHVPAPNAIHGRP